jgi:putative DNA modification/repair radical SAM protein
MNAQEKLVLLADSAKYDVSCASSGTARKSRGALGSASYSGICHSFTADGRCISLLKILLSNICIYDCRYCINRRSNDIRRAAFTPAEIADLTIGFYRRNYIEGLFLSSGVVKSPDYTMELLLRTIKLLRFHHRFNGYIHVKLIPGSSPEMTGQIGRVADRVSVNIELPSRNSLLKLAPEKTKEAILQPMREVKQNIEVFKSERQTFKHAPSFAPAGQSTQMIISASPETDCSILQLSGQLYEKMKLKRVYYSAYVAVNDDPLLPHFPRPELLRESRLYQADWLIRLYGFKVEELFDSTHPNLSMDYDPKLQWALRHPQLFPVEVNTADYESLLRVPGIGRQTALKIVFQRRVATLYYTDLKKIGVVLKRAQFFITAGGKYHGARPAGDPLLPLILSECKSARMGQLSFDFSRQTTTLLAEASHITGEL